MTKVESDLLGSLLKSPIIIVQRNAEKWGRILPEVHWVHQMQCSYIVQQLTTSCNVSLHFNQSQVCGGGDVLVVGVVQTHFSDWLFPCQAPSLSKIRTSTKTITTTTTTNNYSNSIEINLGQVYTQSKQYPEDIMMVSAEYLDYPYHIYPRNICPGNICFGIHASGTTGEVIIKYGMQCLKTCMHFVLFM